MNQNQITKFLTEYEETFPKLIRDKIPEAILKNEGKPARDVRSLKDTNAALLPFAIKKVLEEAGEMYSATSKEDIISGMADLYELLDLIKILSNVDEKDISTYRQAKNLRVGKFDKGLVLYKK